MLVVAHFTVPAEDYADFTAEAEAAVAALSVQPGCRRVSAGPAVDDPTRWVLVSAWAGVGAYRRALSAYDVKVHAAPLLARAHDDVAAFEVLIGDEADAEGRSLRAADADVVGIGAAAGPASPHRSGIGAAGVPEDPAGPTR